MPLKKPAIDYKQLPFEVHYKRLELVSYYFGHPVGKRPRGWRGYKILRKEEGVAYGVSFGCSDASGGQLAHVFSGQLDEFLPDWLAMYEMQDMEVAWTEWRHFTIEHNLVELGEDVVVADDDGYERLEASDYGRRFFVARDAQIDFIVLDAEGSRLVVDGEGYMLAEDDSRIATRPVVEFTEQEIDERDCANRDWMDIQSELYQELRSISA